MVMTKSEIELIRWALAYFADAPEREPRDAERADALRKKLIASTRAIEWVTKELE